MSNKVYPSVHRRSFNCPRCGVYCPQELYSLTYYSRYSGADPFLHSDHAENDQVSSQYLLEIKKHKQQTGKHLLKNWDLYVTVCTECKKYAIFENRIMIFPLTSELPDPAHDMPEDVKSIYTEAASIYHLSPRSASALLRLAIETLIPQLPDFTITKPMLVGMIGELVEQGIPKHIQKALDGIRLYGNHGIHTAEIIVEDDAEMGTFLFTLLNRIVQELITDKKEIDEFYNSFPESKLAAIAQRDKA
jgi:hypothetical protein